MSTVAIIPCLNEEPHLPALLDGLCADPALRDGLIVVADGGSTDRSADIVRARANADPRIKLVHNPKRRQAPGINLAVAEFGGDADFIVRVDAHAAYPAHFITQLIEAQRETGAAAVTVSMRAVAGDGGCFQRAAAAAQNSVLGAGGSAHRKPGPRRFVDHGHHALFTATAFRAAGSYDESFTHNEDAELDARIQAGGGRILLAADIVIDYFPRTAVDALARQYFNYGQGRARTFLKHRGPLKLRQLAPLLVAPAVAALPLSLLWPWLALPAAVWLGGAFTFGLWLGARERNLCAAASGIAAAIMHLAWSLGFFWGAAAMGLSSTARPQSAQETGAR